MPKLVFKARIEYGFEFDASKYENVPEVTDPESAIQWELEDNYDNIFDAIYESGILRSINGYVKD
jgi:hypothetical protein